jgi:uncharacterized protein (TIGR02246 family)
MRRRSTLLLVVCAMTVFAESKHDSDEAKIRQRLATYTEARNHSDAHAEALCYTEDGDFRAFGPPSRGLAEIERALTVSVSGYAFSLNVESLRFLDSNVAIADAHVVAGPPEHKIECWVPTSWSRRVALG